MNPQHKNRLLILLIFGMTLIPFLIAWTLKENSGILQASTNHGHLIVPSIASEYENFTGFDDFSRRNLKELKGHWLMAAVIDGTECGQNCLETLFKTRQIRLMLNKDLPRTRRVALLFKPVEPELAEQWWRQEHSTQRGESTTPIAASLPSDLIRIVPASLLQQKIVQLNPGSPTTGMLLLIDPLGNIMMYYQPGFNPYDVKSDLMHLLKISQIG